MQEYHLGQLEWEEINNVDKPWEDLSILLEMAYKSSKSRLAQTFVDEDISNGTARDIERFFAHLRLAVRPTKASSSRAG